MIKTKNKLINLIAIFSLLVSSFYIYTPQKALAADSWSTGAAGGTARRGHTSIVYDGKIYSWGGRSASNVFLDTIDIYDINSNSWSTASSGGTGRYLHVSVLYNGKIYSWGGYRSDGTNLNTMDIYDITTDSWSTGAPGGTARYDHVGAVNNGKIYFWGGYNDATNFNTMDIYDIATDAWSTGTAGGTARRQAGASSYNDKIYFWSGSIFSGSYILYNTVDIYDIATNTWSTGTAGGTARRGLQTAIYGDNIYYWGGINASGIKINTVDIYNINTYSWSTGTAGGTAKAISSAVINDGSIYYWAGYSTTTINTLDIYDTGYHPNPEFQNLPGETVPINLTEGQVVTTPTYTIEVYPTSPNEIEKAEFYVDNVLIDTDYTAGGDGVYSTIWDTTTYHSDIRVVAYDPFGRTTELTRTVIVPQDAPTPTPDTTVTELPATGMNAVKFSIFNF